MKRFFIWVMLCCFGTLAAQTTLTFTGKDNLDHYVQLHRVVVENLTRNWTDTLYYPDTILMMSGVGLPDYASASAFSVSQNVPNPFDGVTDFTMTLPYESNISIEVHDMSGRRVTGKEQRLQAGAHTFRVWLTVPQTYLLTVKTGHDAASMKMVNNGNASRNHIEYRNASPLTYELRATMGGEHPFESGDLMRYTGVMLYDNVALFSDTIEQPQYEDETFDLVFHLWGQIQDGGQFYSTQSLFIPDGTPCNGSCIGVVGIDVSGYPDGRIIESAEDIRYLRLKMEHSYLGDLWISLVCPNGQSAAVLKKNNNFSNDCTSSIPQGDWGWQTNDNSNVFFGQYYKPDVTGCDPAQNPMGICWNYCWSNNLSEGYQYACSNALVYESCNHIYATNPSPSGQSNSSYVDSTDVANMTNVYHPDISFAALTGCPMNGHWEIRFIDGFASDNGYVENAELALASDSAWHPISMPLVVTGSASNISYTSAVCSGNVTSNGLSEVTARGICWDTLPNPTLSGSHSVEGAGVGTFTSTIDSLVAGTTYYYRAYATNAMGTAYGSQLTFSTIAHTIPEVTTSSVTGITAFSAISGGSVTVNGGLPIIDQGVCWSTEQNPTTADSHIAAGSPELESFTCDITSLTAGTTYYVRAYAVNAIGTGYGNTQTFTTFSAPSGITANYTYVSNTGADVNGNVTNNGGTPLTARGFCWSVTPSPTLLDDYLTVSGTSTGSFSGHITGLIPGTTYYLNAFAINSADTAYSADVTFTTPATPLVTTSVAQSVTASEAIVGGTVVYDGGLLISDRGVCWSTEPEPTLNGPSTSGGSGSGDFTCNLTGLEANTLYYVRAYATNSVTTAYGGTVIFITNDSVFTCGVSTIRDYDDNIYHTVAIGSQCWMKENMRSTRFPDGTLIPLSSTASATEAARCYPNGNAANVAKYGYLYSWSAAMHGNPPIDGQGICPDGWHIPSRVEWESLFSYVGSRPPYTCGGSSGNYAKALAADHTWQSANGTCEIGNGIANNNATDFSMIPAGECEGSYSHFNTVAAFHSSYRQGNYSMVFAFYRNDRYVFDYLGSMVNRMLSVRCLRDLPLNTPTLVAVTHAPESITTTSAVVPLSVSVYDTDSSYTYGVCWSNDPSPSVADNITSVVSYGNGSFSLPLTDLESNTIYYARAFATNNFGTVYGQQRMFHTLDTTNASSSNPILPIVRTTNISNAFNGSSAYCDGDVLFDGYSTVTERGICWDVTFEPDVTGPHLASGSGTGVFSVKANGLTPGMTYYLRAYATNSAGTAYGEELTLTVPELPSVTTLPASNIGGTTASCNGSVISDGFGEILALGICWDTLPDPTLSSNFTTEGITMGTFSSTLTGLTPNTTYHARAYITNKVGTGYGNDITFTTAAIPVITTAPISSIAYTSAVSGGLDIQDNGDSITETGICWSTQPQPDLDGQHLAVGSGTATFSANLTGLTPGLRYYVRAYATNSHGTAYGQELTFTARNDANPCPNDTTVTDFDGNVYHTVQIGEQCWLRENLRSTHYADGSYFTEMYYANNDSTTLALYGRLYKWNTVMHGAESSEVPGAVQGICPNGWHLPAKVEYDTLIDYVIATYTSSQKALASTTGWASDNSAYSPGYQPSTNNASGFCAYPTGTTLTNEGFGKSTAFWTATLHHSNSYNTCAYSLVIRNYTMQPYNSWFSINDKLPVRCVKNN
jgi:uncharacterized protein (TIGR02145 family)